MSEAVQEGRSEAWRDRRDPCSTLVVSKEEVLVVNCAFATADQSSRKLAGKCFVYVKIPQPIRPQKLFGSRASFPQRVRSKRCSLVRLPNPGGRLCSSSHAVRLSCCRLPKSPKLSGKLVSAPQPHILNHTRLHSPLKLTGRDVN